MANETKEILQHINSLLYDSNIEASIPANLTEIDGVLPIDQTIRNLRHAIRVIGDGNLSEKLSGNGYLMGTIKSLQATLRNLIWQTKAISLGDFSHKVEFLGEFSDAFNDMVKKLESTISEVKESKALFELFFETIPDATLIISYKEFKIYNCNHAFEMLVGASKEDLYGKEISEIHFFKDSRQEEYFKAAIMGAEKPQNISLELNSGDHLTYHGLFSSEIIYIENEKYILSVIKNITERKNLEIKLIKSEEIHRLLADNANDVIWVMDLTGKFTYMSPSVEKLRGYTIEEVMAQTKDELLCPSSREYLEKGLEDAIYCVQNSLPFKIFRGDMEQPCKDGTTVWTDLTVSGIYDKDNQFLGMLGVSRDITARRKMEDEIKRITELDHLTQVYNRLKLDAVIKLESERSRRSNALFAIILLDIDNFKRINDTFGHLVGDEVLKDFSQILMTNIRKIDVIGRWGGEEFMIILPESDVCAGRTLAEKLRIKLNEHSFLNVGNITASFGIAEFENGISEMELVLRVDQAMYKAKNLGKDQVCEYSPFHD